jgi:broad specificity phosphatase PhoE
MTCFALIRGSPKLVNVMRVVFIRHGHTLDNSLAGELLFATDGTCTISQGKVLSGWNAVSLSMLGISQAVNAGVLLSQSGIDIAGARWVVSPQYRVQQTFAGVCCGANINPACLSVFVETGVMERSAGSLTSMERVASSSVWSPMAGGSNAPVFCDAQASYPRGESLADVYVRAMEALSFHMGCSEVVIVVAHEMTIKCMLSGLIRQTCDDETFAIEVANASPIVVSLNPNGSFSID